MSNVYINSLWMNLASAAVTFAVAGSPEVDAYDMPNAFKLKKHITAAIKAFEGERNNGIVVAALAMLLTDYGADLEKRTDPVRTVKTS